MTNYRMKFDDNQISVIKADSGPLLVTAGPGSGKTAVLTHRILYLHEKLKIPYEEILVITFTKAAALEMKSRFEKLCESDSKVTFCTFHSLFYSIIKDFKKDSFNIISQNEKLNILKTVLMDLKIDLNRIDLVLLLDDFSRYKNLLDKKGDFSSYQFDEKDFIKIYKMYNDELILRKLLDYDDFVICVEKYFNEDETFFLKWQNKFTYCLIDEFQDINYSQYDIIKKLFTGKGVFAVGDEDQSIYAFRGSSADICLKFKKDFNANVIKLVNNYRSRKSIVEAGMNLISYNTLRFDKKIVSKSRGEGEFKAKEYISQFDEYDSFAKEIKYGLNKGKSVAILLRTNFVSDTLKYVLLKNKIQIEYEKTSKIPQNTEIIDDFLAYFKLSLGELTYKNLLRIANKPNRFISRNFLSECKYNEKNSEIFSYVNLYKNCEDKNYLKANIFKLERNIKELKKLDSFEGLIYIMKVIGYEKYLFEKQYDYKNDFEEMKFIARDFPLPSDFIDYYELLNNEENKVMKPDGNSLKVCTIHASKGREWDEVFIPDVNEGNIPHKRAINKEDTEEERRLFYVAMTRAKEKLWIGFVNDPSRNLKPSIFKEELK